MQKTRPIERSSTEVAGHSWEDTIVGMRGMDHDEGRVFEDSVFSASLLQTHVGASCKAGRIVESCLYTPDAQHKDDVEGVECGIGG